MTKFDNVVHSILNETPDPNLDHWMKEVMNALRGEGFTKVAYNDRGNIEAVGPAEIYQPSMSGSTVNVEVYQHGGKLHAYGYYSGSSSDVTPGDQTEVSLDRGESVADFMTQIADYMYKAGESGGERHGDPEQHPSLTNTQRNQGMVGGPPMSGMIS